MRLDAHSEPQPDLSVLRSQAGFHASAHPAPDDVILVVEVADGSLAYDRDIKVGLYARAAIPETWLVDLQNEHVDVFIHPTPQGYHASRQESELQMLPWLMGVRAVAFVPFRLYEGLWRYTGMWELRNIVAAVLSSSIAFYLLVSVQSNLAGYPRSVYITDAILLICMLSGLRLSYRLYRTLFLQARSIRNAFSSSAPATPAR